MSSLLYIFQKKKSIDFVLNLGGEIIAKARIAPLWSRNVQKAMLDRGMKKKDLAKELRVNYSQMCNVMNGVWEDAYMKWKILDYFGMKEE